MSNRFHSKFHRQNHHTYTSLTNPDAGHDPIASIEQPFWGEFVLNGMLSCVASASAVAGYYYSNHTALCAIAGERGEYIYSFGKLGLEVYSAQSTAISAVGPFIGANISSQVYGINVYGGQYGINTSSPFYGINSYGGTYGGNYYSPVRALSAYGGQYGLDVYSPAYGINSYGGTYGGNYYSPVRALSAYGGNVGLDVYSPISAINAYGGIVAARVYSPVRALSAYGGQYGLDVYSPLTAIKAYGGQVAAILQSPVVSLSTGGGGYNRFDSRVGIYRTPQSGYQTSPNIVLDVNGNSYFDGDLTITGDLSAFGTLTYLDTIVHTTSSLQVVNHTASAAATFIQYGTNQPTLVCYDGDISTNVPTFTVLNSRVGLGVASPDETLTVDGNTKFVSTTANYIKKLYNNDNNNSYEIVFGGVNTSYDSDNINNLYVNLSSNTAPIFADDSFDIISPVSHRKFVFNTEFVTRYFLASGTPTAPLAVPSDITVASMRGFALGDNKKFNSYGLGGNASINLVTDGAQTYANRGGYITFSTIPKNSNTQGSIERMRIASNGNIGIGTSTPNVPLTVNGSISSTGVSTITVTSTSPALLVQQYGTGPSFRVDDTVGDATPFVIDAAGSVGIGTTTPNVPLTVKGSLSATGASTINVNSTSPALLVQQYGSGPSFRVDDTVSDTTPFIIDTAGSVGIGTTTPNVPLTVSGQISGNNTATFNTLAIKDASTTSNATMGTTTLVTGASALVLTSAVATNSRIFLTIQSPSGTVGSLYVSTRTASSSFTVFSTNASDRSTFAWFIVQPS